MKRWLHAQSEEKTFWEKEWKSRKEVITPSYIRNYWIYYIRLAKGYITLKPSDKILDIGCGPVGIINYIDVGEKYGLDPLIDFYLSNFSMPINIRWKQGMAENLPFENEFFDLIFTTNTLDHTAEPKKFLKEIHRCLRSNGYLYLTVNCYGKYVMKLKRFKEKIGLGDTLHPHSFAKKPVRDLLTAIGFEVIVEHAGIGDLGKATNSKEPSSQKFTFSSLNERILDIKNREGYKSLAKKILNSTLSVFERYEGDIIFIAKKNLDVCYTF